MSSVAPRGPGSVAATLPARPTAPRWIRLAEDERVLALALIAPAVVILVTFIAYPFVMAIWFSLTSIRVGDPGHFIGLANFTKAWEDSIF